MSPKNIINLLPIVFFFVIVTVPIIKMPVELISIDRVKVANNKKNSC